MRNKRSLQAVNDKTSTAPRYFVQSLEKGLKMLQIFCEEGKPLALFEIAKKMGTNSALSTRFCYTLCQLGFLQKDEKKRYRLTPHVLTLGYPAVCSLGWHDVAQFYLNILYENINETLSLSILDKTEIIYAIRITKKKYLPFDIRIGSRLPVHCVAMGKVLMAFGRPKIVRPIIKQLKFQPLTAHTISSKDRFEDELKKVRLKGYAINNEELSIGNRTVAVPIYDKEGYAVAAINIAVPTIAYSMQEMEERLCPHLLMTGKKISEALIKIESPIVMGASDLSKIGF
jgi:IclR family transcriptional regulator, pca regulon regulatory protein